MTHDTGPYCYATWSILSALAFNVDAHKIFRNRKPFKSYRICHFRRSNATLSHLVGTRFAISHSGFNPLNHQNELCLPPLRRLRRAAEAYLKLKKYVNLTQEDIQEGIKCWNLVEPTVPGIVDDFYSEILQHAETRNVLQGPEQVQRLKQTLATWIGELFQGVYDERFVYRRWLVGYRHVQIGLSHVWVTAAMTRLRERLLQLLQTNWDRPIAEFRQLPRLFEK